MEKKVVVLDGLAQKFTGLAYKPVTVGGVEVVTVSYVAGGGGFTGEGEAEAAADGDLVGSPGGGIGGVVIPLGTLRADGGRASFVPNWTVLAVVAAPLAALAIWRLTRS